MAPQSYSVVITTDKDAVNFQAQLQNVHVTDKNNKDVPLTLQSTNGVACPCTITIEVPMQSTAPTLATPFDWWVFVALLVPLFLATVLGTSIVFYMLGTEKNRQKTVDKLAQLLSEGDTSKMSLSRVQALLFTYVIVFGCMLIIVRTGHFPTDIPTDLAILTGGSLATYVVSKAIQGSTPQGPQEKSSK